MNVAFIHAQIGSPNSFPATAPIANPSKKSNILFPPNRPPRGGFQVLHPLSYCPIVDLDGLDGERPPLFTNGQLPCLQHSKHTIFVPAWVWAVGEWSPNTGLSGLTWQLHLSACRRLGLRSSGRRRRRSTGTRRYKTQRQYRPRYEWRSPPSAPCPQPP